jgi:hypothetical protein
MKFCYLHQDIEAQGQCYGCGNWICSRDYNLIKEIVGEQKEWIETKYNNQIIHSTDYTSRLVTRKQTGPVIYCSICYETKLEIETEIKLDEVTFNANKLYREKKVLMCTQCGEKVSEKDKFCPSCGDSTRDELFDSLNPIKGVQSSKKMK